MHVLLVTPLCLRRAWGPRRCAATPRSRRRAAVRHLAMRHLPPDASASGAWTRLTPPYCLHGHWQALWCGRGRAAQVASSCPSRRILQCVACSAACHWQSLTLVRLAADTRALASCVVAPCCVHPRASSRRASGGSVETTRAGSRPRSQAAARPTMLALARRPVTLRLPRPPCDIATGSRQRLQVVQAVVHTSRGSSQCSLWLKPHWQVPLSLWHWHWPGAGRVSERCDTCQMRIATTDSIRRVAASTLAFTDSSSPP